MCACICLFVCVCDVQNVRLRFMGCVCCALRSVVRSVVGHPARFACFFICGVCMWSRCTWCVSIYLCRCVVRVKAQAHVT